MGSAFTIAAHNHADLVQGNVSAWHHWQFIAAPPYPHSGLMDGKALTFPWTTSDARALQQSGRLAVSSDGPFTAALPARSVTTLVSDLPGAKPSASR